jgi:hypothetical protein
MHPLHVIVESRRTAQRSSATAFIYALFELVDSLLLFPILRSAMEVSQSPLFRWRFASVDYALSAGQINAPAVRQALVAAEPNDALTGGGYAVYALDTTIVPRPGAKTVPDRSTVYSAAPEKAIPGHQFSWLGRVIALGQSWFVPRAVVRVPTASTPGDVGAVPIQRLAADPPPTQPQVVAVDSHWACPGSVDT